MTPALQSAPEPQSGSALLHGAIALCRTARAPSRALDARIALAVFPGLGALRPVETGIWVQADGSRVRALRYSASAAIAKTLVPAGYWSECDASGVRVCGARGQWAGDHDHEAIALCISALAARLAEKEGEADRIAASSPRLAPSPPPRPSQGAFHE